MVEAVLLAIALAMDATAVAAACGVAGLCTRQVFVLAFAFGGFQAGMAAIGWLLGATTAEWIASWDHWLAFGLLTLIGGKMLYEALRRDASAPGASEFGFRTVLILSLATSIDALAAGVTLPILPAAEGISIALIGVITFVSSLAGGLGGAALGARAGKSMEVLGGLTLIAIAIKTLIDHM